MKRITSTIYSWLTLANFLRSIPTVILVIILYLAGFFLIVPQYSNKFWLKLVTNKLSADRIAIYGITQRIGEYNLQLRLIKGARNLNIDFIAISFEDAITENPIIRTFYMLPINLLNYIFKPKLNLATTHYVNYLPIGYNIVYLNVPTSFLMDANLNFLEELSYLYQYDGYADIYSLVNGRNDYLIKTLSKKKQKYDIYPVYFGDNYKDYSPAKYETALITGSLWGCARNNNRLRRALKHLADDGFLLSIGLPDLAFLGKGYLGPTTKYAKDPTFVLGELQKLHGISLVFTTLEHMIEGIPTLRIAEAAASANLILSDYNHFVRKYFGNSVLYVDTLQNDVEIHKQIKDHILWARQNPEEARNMGEQAYKIFAENFYIEKHLKYLIDSVNSTLSKNETMAPLENSIQTQNISQ